MNRFLIAKVIGLVSTICSVIGYWMEFKDTGNESVETILISVGLLLAFVAYIFAGLVTAIKMALGIAKWGFVSSTFPMCLFWGMLTFALALAVLLILPIIPIMKAEKEYA